MKDREILNRALKNIQYDKEIYHEQFLVSRDQEKDEEFAHYLRGVLLDLSLAKDRIEDELYFLKHPTRTLLADIVNLVEGNVEDSIRRLKKYLSRK